MAKIRELPSIDSIYTLRVDANTFDSINQSMGLMIGNKLLFDKDYLYSVINNALRGQAMTLASKDNIMSAIRDTLILNIPVASIEVTDKGYILKQEEGK